VLIFNPDGTGRMEFQVVYHNSVDFFRWTIVAPEVLDLTRFRSLQLTRSDTTTAVEAESDFRFSGVRFSVAEEERPPGTGQRMAVLRIDLPQPYPSDLGLVSRDLSGCEEPRV
jgi:hypothetical protein